MKIAIALAPLVLLAGCSSPDSASPTPAATPAASAPSASAAARAAPKVVKSASTVAGSASGVVESVDTAGKTVTIATDAVESLKWPAMTMTYQAPGLDLSTIKQGDKVSFEFTSVGMDGTLTSITRH